MCRWEHSQGWNSMTVFESCKRAAQAMQSASGVIAKWNIVPEFSGALKSFSKNLHLLHLLHPPKLSKVRSSFGRRCTFVKSFLHRFCTASAPCWGFVGDGRAWFIAIRNNECAGIFGMSIMQRRMRESRGCLLSSTATRSASPLHRGGR